MPVTMESFGIDRLSAADRLALLEQIWDSLSTAPDRVPVTDAQKHDLARRLAAPTTGSSWEDVKARLLSGKLW